MPQMGTSITEATLVAWTRHVGELVSEDETICEISTDKVDSECPSPASGVVAEILVEAGETVEVGTVLARIAVDGASGLRAPGEDEPASVTQQVHARAISAGEPPANPSASNRKSPYYSPVVRRIASRYGLDLDGIAGSGRNGRVTKQDALAAVARGGEERPLHSESPYKPDPLPTPNTPPPPRAPVDDLGGTPERLSRIRLAIGAAMKRSQAQAATAHTVVECDMTNVEAERRRLGLTALPLVAAATIGVLREFPDLNATLADDVLIRYHRVHLGIAVSLGAEGLIVPVIRDAQNLNAAGLSARIKDLAERARTSALEPDEVQGATFTITSPGAAGALIATPIIDVPQVAILDLEAVVRRPVVIQAADGQEAIAIRSIANLVLGWDHRVIDGMYAAQFLTAIRRRLEAAQT